jgi:hypothetical protein
MQAAFRIAVKIIAGCSPKTKKWDFPKNSLTGLSPFLLYAFLAFRF